MDDSVNILSLYSGSGMHDEAVCAALRVLGFAPRVLGYVEREASAAAWLLARMEAQAMEPSPVWCGDLCDLDARSLRGWVDVLVASPPCKPYSSAGKRRGNADERSHGNGDGPLPHTIRIIDECRPALVQFENVPEWVTGGHFREFGEELCRLGYDIAPPLFLAAADVGAPHERERVFIQCKLAHAGLWSRFSEKFKLRQCPGEPDEPIAELGEPSRTWCERNGGAILGPEAESGRSGNADGNMPVRPRTPNADMAQSNSPLSASVSSKSGTKYASASSNSSELADSFRPRPQGQSAIGGTRKNNEDTGRSGGTDFCPPMFPPGRTDYAAWAELVARGLDPACMPAVERGFSALADGLAFSNSELLRLGGNGVVPLAAGVAFIVLTLRAKP